jgi:hypothetical protein
MRPFPTIFLAAVFAVPGAGRAAGLSYSYVEGGYAETETEVEGIDLDGDGYRLGASLAVSPNYHLVFEYSAAELDVENFNFEVDVDTFALGIGYNRPINPRIDLIGRILYVDSEIDAVGPFLAAEGDENGLGFQMRMRSEVRERLEVEGGIDYVDVGDDETTLVIEGRYFLTDALALGAGLEFGDDTTSYGVTLRFNFGAKITP